MNASPSPLANIALLSDLDDTARNALAARCTWRTYNQAQEIIGKENDTRDVYFIASGSARVVNWSYAGREVSFEDISAGGVFGELAAIDSAPRSATVVALEASELLVFHRRDQLDVEVDNQLVDAQEKFDLHVYQPLRNLALNPVALEMRTTDQRVISRYRLAGFYQLAAHTPRPIAPRTSPVPSSVSWRHRSGPRRPAAMRASF